MPPLDVGGGAVATTRTAPPASHSQAQVTRRRPRGRQELGTHPPRAARTPALRATSPQPRAAAPGGPAARPRRRPAARRAASHGDSCRHLRCVWSFADLPPTKDWRFHSSSQNEVRYLQTHRMCGAPVKRPPPPLAARTGAPRLALATSAAPGSPQYLYASTSTPATAPYQRREKRAQPGSLRCAAFRVSPGGPHLGAGCSSLGGDPAARAGGRSCTLRGRKGPRRRRARRRRERRGPRWPPPARPAAARRTARTSPCSSRGR